MNEYDALNGKYLSLLNEYDEYRKGSTEFEKELEAHIEILERSNQDLKIYNSKLYNEIQSLKRNHESANSEHEKEIASLTNEIKQLKEMEHSYKNYIRELEQSNDDLERAKRAAIDSIEQFDTRLNSAIERNALLENELDDKDQLNETIQRLKDQAKELKQDLDLSRKNNASSDKKHQPSGYHLTPKSSTPSRIAALNIALERKLLSVKTLKFA